MLCVVSPLHLLNCRSKTAKKWRNDKAPNYFVNDTGINHRIVLPKFWRESFVISEKTTSIWHRHPPVVYYVTLVFPIGVIYSKHRLIRAKICCDFLFQIKQLSELPVQRFSQWCASVSREIVRVRGLSKWSLADLRSKSAYGIVICNPHLAQLRVVPWSEGSLKLWPCGFIQLIQWSILADDN